MADNDVKPDDEESIGYFSDEVLGSRPDVECETSNEVESLADSRGSATNSTKSLVIMSEEVNSEPDEVADTPVVEFRPVEPLSLTEELHGRIYTPPPSPPLVSVDAASTPTLEGLDLLLFATAAEKESQGEFAGDVPSMESAICTEEPRNLLKRSPGEGAESVLLLDETLKTNVIAERPKNLNLLCNIQDNKHQIIDDRNSAVRNAETAVSQEQEVLAAAECRRLLEEDISNITTMLLDQALDDANNNCNESFERCDSPPEEDMHLLEQRNVMSTHTMPVEEALIRIETQEDQISVTQTLGTHEASYSSEEMHETVETANENASMSNGNLEEFPDIVSPHIPQEEISEPTGTQAANDNNILEAADTEDTNRSHDSANEISPMECLVAPITSCTQTGTELEEDTVEPSTCTENPPLEEAPITPSDGEKHYPESDDDDSHTHSESSMIIHDSPVEGTSQFHLDRILLLADPQPSAKTLKPILSEEESTPSTPPTQSPNVTAVTPLSVAPPENSTTSSRLSSDESPCKPKFYFIDAASLLEDIPPMPCQYAAKEEAEDNKVCCECGMPVNSRPTPEVTTQEVTTQTSMHKSIPGGEQLQEVTTQTSMHKSIPCEEQLQEVSTHTNMNTSVPNDERLQGNLLFQNTTQQFSQHPLVVDTEPEKTGRPGDEKHPFAYVMTSTILMEAEVDSPAKIKKIDTPSPTDSLDESTKLPSFSKKDPDSIPILSGGFPSDLLPKPARPCMTESWIVDMRKDSPQKVGPELHPVEFVEQPVDVQRRPKSLDSGPMAVGYFLDLKDSKDKEKEKDKKKTDAKKSMFSMFVDFSDLKVKKHARSKSTSAEVWTRPVESLDTPPAKPQEIPQSPKPKQSVFMFIEADTLPKKPRQRVFSQSSEKSSDEGSQHKRTQSFSVTEKSPTAPPSLQHEEEKPPTVEEALAQEAAKITEAIQNTQVESDSKPKDEERIEESPPKVPARKEDIPNILEERSPFVTRKALGRAPFKSPVPATAASKISTSGNSTSGSMDHANVEEIDATLSETSEISSMQSSMERSAAEVTTTETDSSLGKARAPCSRLGEDLLRMFLEEVNTDIAIEVGGRQIRAHKCILSSRCQYFAAMLSGGWIESAGNIISLQGFCYNAVHFALCHIYSGASEIPNTINIVELATLADMLGLEGLKEVISYTLKMKFCHFFHKPCSACVMGVLECLPLAAAYGLDEVYRKSLRWITRYFTRIWPTKAFASLPSELVEKCYQQNVLHLSADNVMDTVLNCDKLLATLPNVRWAEPVFGITTRLLEASIKFMAKNFSVILMSEKFLALGRTQSWNISQLEETILTAIACLSPNESCQSHSALVNLLNQVQANEANTDWSPNFVEFLKKLAQHTECHLMKNANRIVQCQNWEMLDEDVQRKLTDNVFLILKSEKCGQGKMTSLNRKSLPGSSGLASLGSIYCTNPRSTQSGKSRLRAPIIPENREEGDGAASPLVKRAAAVLRAHKSATRELSSHSRLHMKSMDRPSSVPAKAMFSGRLGHQRASSAGTLEKITQLRDPFGPSWEPRAAVKEKGDSVGDLSKVGSPLKRLRPGSISSEKSAAGVKTASTSSSCISTPSVVMRPLENDKRTATTSKAKKLVSQNAKDIRQQQQQLQTKATNSRIPMSRTAARNTTKSTDGSTAQKVRSTPTMPPKFQSSTVASANKVTAPREPLATRPRTASLSQPKRPVSHTDRPSTDLPVRRAAARNKQEKTNLEKTRVITAPVASGTRVVSAKIQVIEKFQRPLSPKVTEPKTKFSPLKSRSKVTTNGTNKPVAVVAPKSTRSIRDGAHRQPSPRPRVQQHNDSNASPKRDVKFLSETSRSGTFLKDEPTVIKKDE